MLLYTKCRPEPSHAVNQNTSVNSSSQMRSATQMAALQLVLITPLMRV